MTEPTVLLGGFAHETNTFADDTTDRAEFQSRREYVGEEIPVKMRGTNTCEGGVIDVAEGAGIDLRYTITASATPGGVVGADAYEFYTDRIVAGAETHREELDGVVLCLHGAMVPEGMDDGEGPLVARVRDVVGPEVPIAVTLDLHGNNTDQLIEAADVLVAFEEYPHTDMGDTGRRAMRLLHRTMRGEVAPTMHVERPPVLAMTPKQNTRAGPMADLMAEARAQEDRDGVLKVNVFPGFQQADVPSMGFSIPVVTDDDPALAREVARELAAAVWDRRESFIGDYPEPAEAVARAKRLVADAEAAGVDEGPVVMADAGDNPGGGGASDGTTLLRELLDQGVTNAGFAIMRDPEAVAECVDAGVGERVTLTIGGKTDDLHGDSIEDVDGYVAAITDGEFVNTGPMATGSENHLGRTVRLECGAEDGVSVLLTENRLQPLDAEIWRHAGIQPERLDVLVVKSTNHYRADYEPMASEVIQVNTPGLAAMDPRKFTFDRIRRPQFPLDEMAQDTYPDWD
ncbi:MAG: M81 family metallopeptidase [Halolamina sp.]